MEADVELFCSAEIELNAAQLTLSDISAIDSEPVDYLENTKFSYGTTVSDAYNSIKKIIDALEGICNTVSSTKNALFGSSWIPIFNQLIAERGLDGNGFDMGDSYTAEGEQVYDMLYTALLKLDEQGKLTNQMKAEYVKTKFPDAPSWDLRLTDILFDNPTLVYKGKDEYKRNFAVKFDAYELYDENSKRNIYLQTDLDSEYDPNLLIKEILNMPESLTDSNQRVILTDKNDVVADTTWKIKYRDFDFYAAAYGGNNEIYLQSPTFNSSDAKEKYYEEYLETYNDYYPEDTYPLSKEEYYEWYDENYGNNTDYKLEMAISTVYHENAHNLDYDDAGKRTISASDEWERAVKSDGNYASEYAEMAYNYGCGYQEDFPDSVKNLYTLGGEEFTKQYPARAKVLEEILPEMFE